MIRALPYRRKFGLKLAGPSLATLALTGLVGCALDREAQVRALLDSWVVLGRTTYFKSTMECTAGLFDTHSDQLSIMLQRVPTVRQGLLLMGHDLAVAFDVAGRTPTEVSEDVMEADLPKGLGVLTSGVAAKNCMDEALTVNYLEALHSERAMLIFDPTSNGLAILDRDRQRIFFARGPV
ncbi:MAG: hypothetical protein GJ676_06825 [Rhodobacteraceae bacterium]|nr:hypothetical protein [Paracoccaceae bacterium]